MHESITTASHLTKASAAVAGVIIAIVAGFALLNNAVTAAGETGAPMADESHGAVGVCLARWRQDVGWCNPVGARSGRKQDQQVAETMVHGETK